MKRIKTILLAFTLWFSLGSVTSASAQVAFSKPDYDVRSGPTTVADFNGDGISDVAVAMDGKIIIYLSPGDGSTGPGTEFSAGRDPLVLIRGDFNNDDIADLAELGRDGTVTLLLGNGDGSFSSPAVTATAMSRVNAALASNDLNNDGILDLALSSSDGTIAVLLGNGDGTFNVRTFASGATYQLGAIEAADFDGDGNVDLAIASCCKDFAFFIGSLQLLHGFGDGTFGPATTVSEVPDAVGVTSADLNQDGHPDLLVPFNGCHTPCRGIAVFMNRGDGTFASPLVLAASTTATLPAVGDFNGDGIPDLAFNDGATVRVYLGKGDGSFSAPQYYSKGPAPFPPIATPTLVGDFNGDGLLDLAAANANNTITLLTGRGDGTFSMHMRFQAGANAKDVASADFNGDGIADLVETNFNENSVSVLLGNGDGTFQPKSDFPAGQEPISVAVADFNGDGATDVAVVNFIGKTVSVLLNDGEGNLSTGVTLTTGTGPNTIVAADFNGDGIADLALTNSVDNNVSVFLANGDGTFAPRMDFATGPSPTKIAVGDFNQDGIADLAIINASNTTSPSITILLGNGDGSFRSGSVIPIADFPAALAVGDFNGDGIPDLAWTVLKRFPSPNEIAVALGNGNGTFGPPNKMPTQLDVLMAISGAEVNGDGLLDLVVIGANLTASGSLDVAIFLGNGDGTLQSPVVFPAGALWGRGVVADFNGDGRPDVAVLTGDHLNVTLSILMNFSH